ncbi:SDR family NAD(P)-dependent oxidoreductase [Paeniroseomonas aquatica]|uniref:SDR family NAD(P)-dependent oxidoreductase n=1 Tax=Paeniroseomonas aquatica TaxID=373043 RepID=UPI0036080E8E
MPVPGRWRFSQCLPGLWGDAGSSGRRRGSDGRGIHGDGDFTGAASILAALAPALEAQGGGRVVALGSVAGDRGRKRNFLYGATKAALRTYLQGYAARLAKAGVRVLCIKAGPVDTAMTWPLPGLPFMVSPSAFASTAWRRARRGSGSTYLPSIWWPVMSIIRLLPTSIFNRLDI